METDIKEVRQEEQETGQELQLDEVQKMILIGCLARENSNSIPIHPNRGMPILWVDIDLPIEENDKIKYLQIQNHWVSNLIGPYLVKSGKETYRLTEEGLNLAHKLRDETRVAEA